MGFVRRAWNLLRAPVVTRDIDRELAFHLAEREDELVAAGLSRQEARATARRQFGVPLAVRERTREVDLLAWLETLGQDVRYGLRSLWRSRGLTTVALGSLALGIGANAAIFSVADALLLRPLGVPDPRGVVAVGARTPEERFGPLSWPDFVDVRDRTLAFAGLAAVTPASVGLTTGPNDAPAVRPALFVSSTFFDTLRVRLAAGRPFQRVDDTPAAGEIAVISHAFRDQVFGPGGDAVGRTLRVNGIQVSIVGVAPARFRGADPYFQPSVYLPMGLLPRIGTESAAGTLADRGAPMVSVLGRLADGATLARAEDEVRALATTWRRDHPSTHARRDAVVRTEMGARLDRSPVQATLVALLSLLALLVLLVSCANVAGLLLGRAATRVRELAVRSSIGAGRGRLVRQLLTESLLLGGLGATAGLGVAAVSIEFLQRLRGLSDGPTDVLIALDTRVLVFAMTTGVISAIVFGLAPALSATRLSLVPALKSGELAAPPERRLTGRRALVIGQIALSLVLATVATVVYLGFRAPLAGELGFRSAGVLLARTDTDFVRADAARAARFYASLGEALRNRPEVMGSALSSVIPMDFEQTSTPVLPEGTDPGPDGALPVVLSAIVDDHYFDLLDIPVLRGRAFAFSDRLDTPRVAVVNTAFADRFWPGRDPVGKRLRLGTSGDWIEVVGVTATGKYGWIAEPPTEFLYLPFAQHPRSRMVVLTRARADAAGVAAPLRRVVRELEPALPVSAVRPMDDYLQVQVLGIPRTLVIAIASLGALGLALALVGLHALVAYSVSRRTREIGVRMALGADRRSVRRMVIAQGVRLGAAGILLGLALGFVAERLLVAAFADATSAVVVYLLGPPLLVILLVLASAMPARRAAAVDPLVSMRAE